MPDDNRDGVDDNRFKVTCRGNIYGIVLKDFVFDFEFGFGFGFGFDLKF